MVAFSTVPRTVTRIDGGGMPLFFRVFRGELCRTGCESRAGSPRMLRNRPEDFNAPSDVKDIEIFANYERV